MKLRIKEDDRHMVSYSTGRLENITNISPKRKRLSPETIAYLNYVFEVVPKPTTRQRVQIAEKIKTDQRIVQVWFQNRRAKLRREQREQRNSLRYDAISGTGIQCVPRVLDSVSQEILHSTLQESNIKFPQGFYEPDTSLFDKQQKTELFKENEDYYDFTDFESNIM